MMAQQKLHPGSAEASRIVGNHDTHLHNNAKMQEAAAVITRYAQQQAQSEQGYFITNGNHWRVVFEAARAHLDTAHLSPQEYRALAEGLAELMKPFVYDQQCWQEEGQVLFSDKNIQPKHRMTAQEKRQQGQDAADRRILVVVHYVYV